MQPRWDYPFPFLGLAVEGFPLNVALIDRLDNEAKFIPAVVVFYLQWSSEKHALQSSLDAIWNNQSVPCMTWEPITLVNEKQVTIPYEDILKGLHDNYLNEMASEIKSWGKPIIIRFAQEMNLSKYHWGTSLEDYNRVSPNIYGSMFQYVVSFFRNKQVDNVLWVFCPNVESVPRQDWNIVKSYYPGDEYVDILGMDGYNWDIDTELAQAKGQTWTQPWRSFREIFEPMYQQLKEIAPKKPIIVFETASVDRSQSDKKILWLNNALKVAKEWDIQGIIWFQVSKEEDWKLVQEINSLVEIQKPSFQDWLFKNFKDFR